MSTPPRRALLVIDVQNEYITGQLPIKFPPVSTSLPNITLAMDSARVAGIPVVTVQHDAPAGSPVFAVGSPAWQLHPEVAARHADHHIHKQASSAFAGTGLAQWLKDKQIDTLTIAGYMTHNCDAATIYHAAHDGLTVEFLADATGSLPYENAAGTANAEEIHRVYSTVFHSNFAAVTSTANWVMAVQERQVIERDNIYASNQRARNQD